MASALLPEPRRGAVGTVHIATAVAADIASAFFPGAATGRELIIRILERRIRNAQHILVERLKEAGIEALSDEAVEELVPSAYRFYQAARDGEARHNLRILAGIIAGRITHAQADSADFLRVSRQLEGLTLSDLAALVAVREVDMAYRSGAGRDVDVRDNRLISKVIPRFFKDKNGLAASLSLLAGRGLIAPDQQTSLDASLQAYLSTPALDEIVELAKRELSGSQKASSAS